MMNPVSSQPVSLEKASQKGARYTLRYIYVCGNGRVPTVRIDMD